MEDELILEVQKQTSWGGWRWCPTSADQLRDAERSILTNLKTLNPGKFVDIGCVGDSEASSQVWTLRANLSSPNTPLVLVHGFGSGSALWCLNIDALAQHRPVYALDILGFGRSSRPDLERDALKAEKQFISSLEAWRREVGLDKFILLGHAFGGFLAASYAIKYSDRVAHLILVDPWGFPERPLDVDEHNKLPIWARALGAIATYFNPLSLLRLAGPIGPWMLQKLRPDLTRKFHAVLPNADTDIPTYLYHCNAQAPSGETAFQSLMCGFGWAQYPMVHRLEALQRETPITLIYGSRSWVDRDPGFQIKYSRPACYVDVQILQGAGHHVYADRADRFNTLVCGISRHVDRGTLPDHGTSGRRSSSGNTRNGKAMRQPSVAETLSNFISVRRDTKQLSETPDQNTSEESGSE